MKFSKLLPLLAILACLPAFATTRYIAQSAGTVTCNGGSRTAITPTTWAGISESASDIDFICGTITTSSGTAVLTKTMSGSSGNPITIKFDTGAILQSPEFPMGGALSVTGSWITVDGGTNGIIRNTLTGTAGGTCPGGSCVNQGSGTNTTAVTLAGDNNTVQNLTVATIYVHTPYVNDGGAGDGSSGILVCGNNALVAGNTVSNVNIGIGNNDCSNKSVYEARLNTLSLCNHCVSFGIASGTYTGISIHNNDISDTYAWDQPDNGYHHNYIFTFGDPAGTLTGQYYNNYFHGTSSNDSAYGGSHTTALIFLEYDNANSYVFNNVFALSSGDLFGTANGYITAGGSSAGQFIYNNTFIDPNGKSECIRGGNNSLDVRNNVFNGCWIAIDWSGTIPAFIGNQNIYYNINSGWIWKTDAFINYAQWQADCLCDASSTNGVNPNISATTFIPNSGSPAIGFGANLTSVGITPLDSDKAGNARPSSGAWTSGALNAAGSFTPCPTVISPGWCNTGLSAIQNNLLGPLIPQGASPWVFGDLAEIPTAGNIAPAAIAEIPTLGAAASGTFSWTSGTNTVTTSADQTGAFSINDYIVLAWNTVDGNGTGRQIQQISNVTSTTLTFYTNNFAPTSSGITAYHISSTPDVHGWTFLAWTQGCPAVTWNYYDAGHGLYKIHYRQGSDTAFLSYAQQFADIQWQWVIDHGYTFPCPRAASMISQFFRAGEAHPERFPGLYAEITTLVRLWANPAASPAIDNRESGYTLWDVALGAKTDTDPTRHAQYCTWLNTFVPTWNSVQAADGSWPENEYALNPSFVSAPKTFTAPFLYQGAPWREAINVKGMEAAYESLNDTTTQGCNNPTLAVPTLAAITKAVTWQNNYGRDTSNRGTFYEVNSQSNDQATAYPATGTVSISTGSTSLTGSGTNWQTAGYCDGTHFVGLNGPRTVYKIVSCTSDTAATISAPFGLYGESSNLSGSAIAVAPSAVTICNSSATYCYIGTGDLNLNRTVCGGIGWLYNQTLNATYLGWTNECLSQQLGGPTAGLTPAVSIPSFVLPCSGPACNGYVPDTFTGAPVCGVSPCVNGGSLYGNLGKNFGEAFGAPGIDNALAWRLLSPVGPPPPPPPPPPAPVITSALVAPGTQGTAFSYQITASNTPTTFGASNLPTGLTITTFSGVISGTPTVSGTFSATITATNSGGTGTATLVISISNPPPPPPPAPIITSSLTGSAVQNSPFSYQIAASNSPTSYGATGLPTGLSVNTSSGLISGTPTVAGNFHVNISATNSGGTGAAVLTLVVAVPPPPAPTITSALTDTATNGSPYSYQITATNTPTSFGATSLPAGLSVNTSTGLISGTPTVSGNFNINISATNSGGTGTGVLKLAISSPPPPPPPPPAPVITSALTATTPQGSPFTYQIAATNSPTGYGASGLPSGLSVSTSTGFISGTPTGSGSFSVTISAINSGGTGTAVLALTVTPPPPPPAPVITSSLSVSVTQGTSFSYRITATNTPTGFGATSLPPGLSVVTSTGVISGTPSAAGNYNVGISAVNAGGTGTASLALTIIGTPPPPPPPTLTCDLNHDGVVNILDVQIMTNQVLGTVACTNNLSQTGSCNQQDIQRVITAAQGGACRIGP